MLALQRSALLLETPRVVSPSRSYFCHLAGLSLKVDGLAWQQQDSAVGACATIALWSMLHSSALDGHHGLPTTASVTRSAHRTASLGRRMFPSGGLSIEQLCEAIKEHGLQPVVVPGDLAGKGPSARPAFSRERFSASCSALLRSGFPVLVLGQLRNPGEDESIGGHAICAVGFRSAPPPVALPGTVVHHDANIPVVYVHDDNIGPNVRFKVSTDGAGAVFVRPEAPVPIKPPTLPDPTTTYPEFVPGNLVVAVPEDLRSSPDALHEDGLRMAKLLSTIIAHVGKTIGHPSKAGLTVSSRFSRLRDYLGQELSRVIGSGQPRLGAVRLRLVEEVPPMSMHVGVIRVGDGATPLFDVIRDTTDSDQNRRAFAHIVYERALVPYLDVLRSNFNVDFGHRILAT